jgi:hypothetical protein
MTASKAIAGGVAANIVTVVLWAISNVPGWDAVPDEPRAAIIALASAAVGAAIVYVAPANRQMLTAKAFEHGGEIEPTRIADQRSRVSTQCPREDGIESGEGAQVARLAGKGLAVMLAR